MCERAMLGLGIFSRALPQALQGMAALVGGARGYRTSRLTQKMGRKFVKGRGAKSFGYITTKGARERAARPRAAAPGHAAAHRTLLLRPPTPVRRFRPEQNADLPRARLERHEGDLRARPRCELRTAYPLPHLDAFSRAPARFLSADVGVSASV